MLIKRVHIQNFRSIRDLTLDLSATTVLIGPNNAGKTSILEAIHIALTRRWGQRGTGFTEYDIHLPEPTSDPKTCGPVIIELDFQESAPDDWSEDLRSDLNDITQVDPISGMASIFLRVSCAWDAGESNFVPKWEFLNSEREAVSGRGARNVNLSEFFQYLPVFYLDAVRDAADEFSTRSQFWNKLLRSITIPSALEKRAERVLDLLNGRLLNADPKLDTLATTLSGISTIAAGDEPGEAQLRMVPLRAWDLLSRAEVIYQSEAEKPWLPLARHGQGIQSLSVMFLFRAFVEQLMTEIFKPGRRQETVWWSSLLDRYWHRFEFWLPTLLESLGDTVGLSPPVHNCPAAWKTIRKKLGPFPRMTHVLVGRFRVTIFGRYRCHSPAET